MGEIDNGTINYAITKIISHFYDKPSYKILQRGIGVLETVKLEFYRRAIAPLEDEKILENGDVY